MLFAQVTNNNSTGDAPQTPAEFDWSGLFDKQVLMEYAINIGGALLLFLSAWIIAGWVSRIAGSGMRRAKIDETLTRFAEKMVRWLVIICAVIAALSMFGIETTSFAAVLGAAGLAIGLAFQGTLSNLAAGVMLLIFRPFNVGDAINAAGVSGKVDAIGIFTTTSGCGRLHAFYAPGKLDQLQ